MTPCLTAQNNPIPSWLRYDLNSDTGRALRYKAFREIRRGLGQGNRRPIPDCCLLAIRLKYVGYPITGFRTLVVDQQPILPPQPNDDPGHSTDDEDELPEAGIAPEFIPLQESEGEEEEGEEEEGEEEEGEEEEWKEQEQEEQEQEDLEREGNVDTDESPLGDGDSLFIMPPRKRRNTGET